MWWPWVWSSCLWSWASRTNEIMALAVQGCVRVCVKIGAREGIKTRLFSDLAYNEILAITKFTLSTEPFISLHFISEVHCAI